MYISIKNVFLITVLIIGAFLDIREKRIPNVLTFPAMTLAVIFNLVFNGFSGLYFSIMGLVIGLALFIVPFALGLMGAGDVKLMAAIGALMGWKFTFLAALFSAIAGIFVVFIYLIYKKKLLYSLKTYAIFVIRPIVQLLHFSFKSKKIEQLIKYIDSNKTYQVNNEKLYVPYGLAIALGTLFTLSGIFKEYLPF